MKGLWLRATLVVLSLSSVAFAGATSNWTGGGSLTWDFLGGGARAQGMGKAFYGVSDDISAVTWNPAGLAKQEKPVIGFSKGAFVPRGSFTDFGATKIVDPATGGLYSQNQSFSSFSFLGFLAPLRIRGHQFVLSAAYNRAYDEYATSNYYDTGQFAMFKSGDVTYYTHGTGTFAADHQISPYTFTVGFGTRMYHTVDFGVALNVYTGHSTSHLLSRYNSPAYLPTTLLGQTVNFDSTSNITDTTRYGGINLVFGLKYTSEKFDGGLVVKTPYSLQQKVNSVREEITRYNGIPILDLSDTIFYDNQMVKVKVPMVIGIGGAYRFAPNWIGAADVEFRPWSGKKMLYRDSIIIRSGRSNQEFYTTLDPQWFNSVALRFGTEYVASTGSRVFPKVPLRAGLAFATLPGPSYELPANVTVVTDSTTLGTFSKSMFSLSLGSGVQWDQIHLDLAYTYSHYGQDYPFGEMKVKNHHVTLTFTGYF